MVLVLNAFWELVRCKGKHILIQVVEPIAEKRSKQIKRQDFLTCILQHIFVPAGADDGKIVKCNVEINNCVILAASCPSFTSHSNKSLT